MNLDEHNIDPISRLGKIMELFPEVVIPADRFYHEGVGLYVFLNSVGVQWRMLGRSTNSKTAISWRHLERSVFHDMESCMPGCHLIYQNRVTSESTEFRVYLFSLPENYRFIREFFINHPACQPQEKKTN